TPPPPSSSLPQTSLYPNSGTDAAARHTSHSPALFECPDRCVHSPPKYLANHPDRNQKRSSQIPASATKRARLPTAALHPRTVRAPHCDKEKSSGSKNL